jgi:hypothetical protein
MQGFPVRSVLFSLFLTLALAGGAAGLAFVAGRASVDAAGQFELGVEEGERVARATARAGFVPGAPAYRAAVEQGRKAGFTEGRRVGRAEGARRGRRSGRSAAFAGFRGGWEVGRWYIVAIAPAGEAGGEVGINARVPVRRGVQYGLCAGRSRICETPARRATRTR